MIHESALIGMAWGTTRFRAFRIGADGQIGLDWQVLTAIVQQNLNGINRLARR
jgi:2-keto-3-deoxy-galactonokinase